MFSFLFFLLLPRFSGSLPKHIRSLPPKAPLFPPSALRLSSMHLPLRGIPYSLSQALFSPPPCSSLPYSLSPSLHSNLSPELWPPTLSGRSGRERWSEAPEQHRLSLDDARMLELGATASRHELGRGDGAHAWLGPVASVPQPGDGSAGTAARARGSERAVARRAREARERIEEQ
jgi:hypothetical protein